jgi:hypothetical protein
MADPIVHITSGIPDAGTGNITTLGLTIPPAGTATGLIQGGPMCQAAVLAAAPTYTTTTTNPLTMNLNGALRVDGSGVTQPVSGTVSVSGTTTVSGTVAATQSGTWTVQPGNTANTTAWLVTGTGGTFPITAASLPLPTGAATSANQTNGTQQVQITDGTRLGTIKAASTAAVATDTALVVAISPNNTVGVSGTVGISGTVSATQSGTWTVQPGNTANTTAWLVTGTGGTFPATQSGTWTVQPGNTANTVPWLTTINQGGNSATVTGANALKVDGSAVTQPVSGTVTAAQPTAANLNATVIGTGTFAVQASQSGNWTTRIVGNTGGILDTTSTLNSVSPGNMLITGGTFNSTPSAIATGNASPLQLDKQGKLLAVGAVRTTKGVQKTSITTVSETTVITAGAAGVFNDVYAFIITNKSATPVFVDFRDSTAGSVKLTLAAPASDTRGFTVPVDSAMVQGAAANNWTATVSTGVTSIEITALYVSNI